MALVQGEAGGQISGMIDPASYGNNLTLGQFPGQVCEVGHKGEII